MTVCRELPVVFYSDDTPQDKRWYFSNVLLQAVFWGGDFSHPCSNLPANHQSVHFFPLVWANPKSRWLCVYGCNLWQNLFPLSPRSKLWYTQVLQWSGVGWVPTMTGGSNCHLQTLTIMVPCTPLIPPLLSYLLCWRVGRIPGGRATVWMKPGSWRLISGFGLWCN